MWASSSFSVPDFFQTRLFLLLFPLILIVFHLLNQRQCLSIPLSVLLWPSALEDRTLVKIAECSRSPLLKVYCTDNDIPQLLIRNMEPQAPLPVLQSQNLPPKKTH